MFAGSIEPLAFETFPLHAVASLAASTFTFLTALTVKGRARLKEESRPFVLICLLISVWTLVPFASWKIDESAIKIWVLRALYLAAVAVPAAFAWLIFSVLGKSDANTKRTLFCFWVLTAIFFALGFTGLMIRDAVSIGNLHVIVPGNAFHLFVGYFIFACGYTFLHLINGMRRAAGFRKNQLRYYLIGFLLAYLSGALHFVSQYLHWEPVPHDFFVIAFVSVLAYAIIKHRVMDVNLVARYALVQILFGLLIGAPLGGLTLWLNHPVYSIIIIFILAMGAPTVFGSVRQTLTEAVDRLPVFQGRYERFSSLQNHLDRLSSAKTLAEWANQIISIAFDLYRAKTVSLLVRDEHRRRFIIKNSRGLSQASAVFMSLSMDGNLAKYLTKTQNTFITETGVTLFSHDVIAEVEADLKFLHAAILVPIINEGELYAILVLGEKNQSGAYNDLELTSLSALGREAEHDLQVIMSGLSQEQMTAVWAHDLVKPFTLKGSFQYLQDMLAGRMGPVSEDVQTALQLILEDTRFVRDNLMRLLHPGKDVEYNIIPGPLTELFKRIRDKNKHQSKTRAIQWNVVVPPVDVRVFCDASMIEHRVIDNLVENALRHTPRNGKVEMGYQVKGDRFVCYVSDTGPGVKEGDRSKIFEARSQTDESLGGLAGLGLFSAKSVVEAHKGKIWVESEFGSGATFYFDLPLASGSL